MAVILSLESSASSCSVAIHDKGELLSLAEHNVSYSAASQLAVMADRLLKSNDIQPSDIRAVAVSAGPGSYTGLRIGVATAKGICCALETPLIAVNTLEHMAAQISPRDQQALLCPMLDARRMEVYSMLLNDRLEVVEPTCAVVVEEGSYDERLTAHEIWFFGPGSDKCRALIRHVNARFVPGIRPTADKLGELAYAKFAKRAFENAMAFEPLYLKDFIAKKPKSYS